MIAYEIVQENDTQNAQWHDLKQAENDINDAWLKEGLALRKIRDNALYKLRGYDKFSSYYENHLKYDRSTVSRRISAAETALQVRIDTEKFAPSQSVYRTLSTINENDRQSIIDKACEISVSCGDERLMVKHVQQAKILHEGGYDSEVLAVAETYQFSNDIDKLNIVQRWYDRGKDNTDGKFWALAGSGVIDPSDGKEAIEFASATVEDIANVEYRWKLSKMASDNPNPPIEGIVNEVKLVVDGQNIVLPIIGKKVKINIKVFE